MFPEKPIPFFTSERQNQALRTALLERTEAVLDDAVFSGGPWIDRFENDFAAYCRINYAAALSNGTDALHLALRALGVGSGNEVLVPANGYLATAAAVVHAGAVPVFVDCTPDTWQLDPVQVDRHRTPRTKAVIGVHLYGQPFDVEAVRAVTEPYGVALLEDAAQAQGALYRQRRVGSLADGACFSFYPTKNLGALGEAGAFTTHREDLHQRVVSLRQHGMVNRPHHDEIGYNHRMDSLQAAFLHLKLAYLDNWNHRRQRIATRYETEFTNSAVRLQVQPDWGRSVYHLFVVTVPDREHFMAYLQDHQILPGLHYPISVPDQRAFSAYGHQPGDFPHAAYLAAHCLSLPMFPELTDDEVSYVIETVNAYKAR